MTYPPHLAQQAMSGDSQRAAPQSLGLPCLQPQRNGSVSSLMDAVVGSDRTVASPPGQPYNTLQRPAPHGTSGGIVRSPLAQPEPQRQSRQHMGTTPSGIETTNTASSSSGDHSFVKVGQASSGEWDVLSDASARVNQGRKDDPSNEAVKELEEKVNKRRSQLPRLESQLADLEAQIKAAEERLARVQGAGAAVPGAPFNP
ncbi:hypothetical protein IAU60_004611 [Kwoniella sp. DSM 27419]